VGMPTCSSGDKSSIPYHLPKAGCMRLGGTGRLWPLPWVLARFRRQSRMSKGDSRSSIFWCWPASHKRSSSSLVALPMNDK
jgi:hypothetical protein